MAILIQEFVTDMVWRRRENGEYFYRVEMKISYTPARSRKIKLPISLSVRKPARKRSTMFSPSITDPLLLRYRISGDALNNIAHTTLRRSLYCARRLEEAQHWRCYCPRTRYGRLPGGGFLGADFSVSAGTGP